MKNTTLGIGVLAGGMLAVSLAQAGNCCPGHRAAAEPAALARADHGGHAHDHGAEKKAPPAADAPEKEIKLQTTCPVMGGAINKDLYVDHDGKRVYICCKGCEAPLKKDPATYIQKLEDAGVTVATLQTECPVMGGNPIDRNLYVDHDGKRIYVCCRGCIAEVGKDPAKTIRAMEAAGVALHRAGKADKAEPPKPAAGHEGHRHDGR